MIEHPRPDVPGTGNVAHIEAMPPVLRRVAVMAPDDAPGLFALRERLGDWPELSAEHHAAGFRAPHSAALPDIFDRILERHSREPYDAILLLDGRADALGIAESTRLIPEQMRRMPMPVWSAIGEDDANTEIGDVAARTFSSPAALFDALQRSLGARTRTKEPTTVAWLPVPLAAPALPEEATHAASRPRPHPLLLCAAIAVILASMTAIAAMLGILPELGHRSAAPAVPPPTNEAAASSGLPKAAPALAAARATSTPAQPALSGTASKPATVATMAAPVAPVPPESPAVALPEVGAVASPKPAVLPEPASQSRAPANAVPQPAVAAPVQPPAAAPSPAERERPKAAAAGPPRSKVHVARRAPKRKHGMFAYAQASTRRAPGSEEIPSFNFVGTKTRAQVIAEMIASRRRGDANEEDENGSASRIKRRFRP
jgi:hypothetical protein